VHLDTIESFIYPTDAQIDFSKNVKIYNKIYMRGAATCFGSWFRASAMTPMNKNQPDAQ
jgi:hypothetical protein